MSLEIKNLSHRYGRQAALDRVSLTVQPGQCYGLLGHNGAGKTTALRIALGLMNADSGEVWIDGRDARVDRRHARQKTGGLIEVTGFYGGLSGRKNLILLARLAGMTRKAARAAADEALDRVGLSDVGKKPVKAYSLGMKQRLSLAQALLERPAYLILDEPTNGLDPEGIADVRNVLRRLVDEDKVGILLSSHQLHEVAELCDRVGVMKSGKMVLESSTAELTRGSDKRRLIVDDADRAQTLLAAMGVQSQKRGESTLTFTADQKTAAIAARTIVGGQIDLYAFVPETASLEDIYLSATRGASTAGQTATAPESASKPPAPSTRFIRSVAQSICAIGRTTRHELARARRPMTLFLLLLPILFSVFPIWTRHRQAVENDAKVASGEVFSTSRITAFQGVAEGLQAGLPILLLVIVAMASQSIAAEADGKTLRNLFLRPVRRFEVAIGKFLALGIVSFVFYLALVGSIFWLATRWFEFADVEEVALSGVIAPLVPKDELWPELRHAVLSPLLPLAGYAAAGFLVGSLVRSAAGALAGAFGLVVLLDVGRAVARTFQKEDRLLSAFLPSPLGDTSPVRRLAEMSTGVSNAFQPYLDRAVSTPGLWLGIALFLAIVAVSRRSCP